MREKSHVVLYVNIYYVSWHASEQWSCGSCFVLASDFICGS
jgi:hypothetical protein